MTRKRTLLRFHVVDWSMAPTLVPGDRLMVDPETYMGRRPEKGDLIVISDPELEGRKLIKRVKSVVDSETGTLLYVVGDNELKSRDSRHFGSVALDRVIGVVETHK